MELKYSNTGVPYIDFINGVLIFSRTTESDKGFKYLVFRSRKISSVCTSGAKAKRKRYVDISEDIGFTVNMDLKRDSGGKKTGIPNDARFCLTRISEKILKKMLKELVVGEHFPRSNLQKLDDMLRSYYNDETDSWDNDPTATKSYDDIGEEEKKKPSKKKLTLAKKPKRKLKLAKPKSIIKKKK